jgi:hypothetical protein
MPDISTINTVAVADIDKFQSITFAHGQKVNNQDVSLEIPEGHTWIADNSSDTTNICEVDFTTGIDNTYDVYEFVFTNLNSASDNVNLTFQVNDSEHEGGTWNNSPMTTIFAAAHHREDDAAYTDPYYETSFDQAQGTAFTIIATYLSNDADDSASGSMVLYAPSSTTYVKHWFSRVHCSTPYNGWPPVVPYTRDALAAGYINTGDPADQPAITEIRFKMSSGNFDGLIEMYGLAKS